MSRVWGFGLISIGILTGLVLMGIRLGAEEKKPVQVAVKIWPTPTPITIRPVRLKISKLKIDASVEEVGVTETGAMDVPKNVVNVGWFRAGVG